jgi:hypothetical protein
VRTKRLYINGCGITEGMAVALNNVPASAVRARRRGRNGGSSSDSGRDLTSESDQSDAAAYDVTRDTAAAVTGSTVGFRPRFVRKRPRRFAGAKDLIPLEVFSIYGWRPQRRIAVTQFMRYLARNAPHLREVGLVRATGKAVLALRHAASTSLTGLDLRYIESFHDVGLATLLSSRVGRRLRSLRVNADDLFRRQWPYAALNRREAKAAARASMMLMLSDESTSDTDAAHSTSEEGDNNERDADVTEATTEGQRWLGSERRLRRLRHLHIQTRRAHHEEAAHAVFNGKRVVFTPYAVVPPL